MVACCHAEADPITPFFLFRWPAVGCEVGAVRKAVTCAATRVFALDATGVVYMQFFVALLFCVDASICRTAIFYIRI